MAKELTIDGRALSFATTAAILGAGFAIAATASAFQGDGVARGARNGERDRTDAVEMVLAENDVDLTQGAATVRTVRRDGAAAGREDV